MPGKRNDRGASSASVKPLQLRHFRPQHSWATSLLHGSAPADLRQLGQDKRRHRQFQIAHRDIKEVSRGQQRPLRRRLRHRPAHKTVRKLLR